MGEFELIARYFQRPPAPQRSGPDRVGQVATPDPVVLGIGDDCALLRPQPGMQLAVSSDMLVEGRHFLSTVAPALLGHKVLAVNLSDLAACGAQPLAFTLALAMPRADGAFLAPFAQGLFALADAHGIALIGGDTTGGPLNICITVFGQVPCGQALLRSGARAGDELWVSGALGDARLALECFRGTLALPGEAFAAVRRALEQPAPQVALGLALRGVATAAIDLSDGLLGDLAHLLARSQQAMQADAGGRSGEGAVLGGRSGEGAVLGGRSGEGAVLGAVVHFDALPRSAWLAAQPPAVQRLCLLGGGDDYALLFTAAPERRAAVLAAGRAAGVALTCCGHIDGGSGLRVVDAAGRAVGAVAGGFDHFAHPPGHGVDANAARHGVDAPAQC